MFADVGLRGNVIYHQNGDNPKFLDTVWSIQIIKGVCVWALVSLLAYPAALFYDQPELLWIIPVTGASSVILGIQSTAVYSTVRHVIQKRKVLFEAASKFAGFTVMLSWAWISPGVEALVFGGTVTALMTCLLSRHLLPERRPDQWGIDKEQARQIFRFGRWILISTALTFLFVEADKIVLGKLLTTRDLGIYSIAALSSVVVLELITRLSTDILFPLYAKMYRSNSDTELADTAQLRFAIAILGSLPLWLIALFGQEIIGLLYDSRYQSAGWMAQILAIGTVAQVLVATSERALLAKGNSYLHMCITGTRTILVFSGMAIGILIAGIPGLLYGLVVSRWLGWVLVTSILAHHKTITLKVDISVIFLTIALLCLGYLSL